MVYVSWAALPQVGEGSVASCFRAGGGEMPGTAFLSSTEGCAQALSHQHEASDVKRSSSATVVGLVQRKLREHSECVLGCKVTGAAQMVVAACQEHGWQRA